MCCPVTNMTIGITLLFFNLSIMFDTKDSILLVNHILTLAKIALFCMTKMSMAALLRE